MADNSAKPNLTGFSASGILGTRHYRLRLDGPAAIIVGPNGTGKSTFLSLFYLMISRQWNRLNEYDFDTLTIYHTNGQVDLEKADLLAFENTSNPRSGSVDRYISRLYENNAVDLIYKANLTKEDRLRFARSAGVPVDQVTAFRKYFQQELPLGRSGMEIDHAIRSINIGPILYLPTYRRIEKDIKSIFPDIESRIKSRIEEANVGPRTGQGFKEIASFGMNDVRVMIESYTNEIREFQRLSSESASQEYIRDIVRGKIKNYSLSNLRKMDEKDFDDFKNGLDDKLFSDEDRKSLRSKIDDLRLRQNGQPNAESRYLGMFVEKLLAAHQRVKERGKPLRMFVDMISAYLKPDKQAVIRGHDFVILSTLDDEAEIALEKLSSGEKQIVSVFAYLLLAKQQEFIVFIDEPELSLSVPWQKRFLPDIVDTGSCAHLITVTHSPFVFDNHLKKSLVDVRRLRVSTDG